MEKKKNYKFKLYSNIAYVIIIAILFIVMINILFKYVFNGFKQNKGLIVNYDLSTDILPDPIQTEIPPDFINLQVKGETLNIKKLAEYDITGRVLEIKRYTTNPITGIITGLGEDPIDYISPVDLALTWGELAKNDNSKYITTQPILLGDSRRVMVGFRSDFIKTYGENYIRTHHSNNHLITLDYNFRNMLAKVKIGDVVRIQGYLVYLTYIDKNKGVHWWGPSSLTRTDSGDGACEIIYIEDMVIMP